MLDQGLDLLYVAVDACLDKVIGGGHPKLDAGEEFEVEAVLYYWSLFHLTFVCCSGKARVMTSASTQRYHSAGATPCGMRCCGAALGEFTWGCGHLHEFNRAAPMHYMYM
jgi:hypothetical protein